jgi:hypothetical protein
MKGQNIHQMPSSSFTTEQKHSTIKQIKELEIENQDNRQSTSSQTTMSRYRTDTENENTFCKHHLVKAYKISTQVNAWLLCCPQNKI